MKYHISEQPFVEAEADSSFIDASHQELEEVFGIGSVRSFAWPFGPQNCKLIEAHFQSLPEGRLKRGLCERKSVYEATGKNFRNYVVFLRVEYAKQLLIEDK